MSDHRSYTVYILCCGDDSLYTGITNDLDRRLAEHQAGRGGRYTRSHLPVRLVYRMEGVPGYAAACRIEARIKTWSRGKKLRLVSGDAVLATYLRDLLSTNDD